MTYNRDLMIQKSVSCAVIGALLAAGLLSALSGVAKARQAEPTPGPAPQEVVTPSGLRYKELQVGQGTEAAKGRTVEVLYTGRLEDGTKFDSSRIPAIPSPSASASTTSSRAGTRGSRG